MSSAWIPALVALQRLFELALCRRNRKALAARGGREHRPETYVEMVALHALFILSLACESYPWRIPPDAWTWGCLGAYLLVTGLRYWTIAALGGYWTTRIVVVPGSRIVRSGPYRFLRHPNYLVIVLEFLILPLLLRAPVTLIVFSLANIPVLRRRIRFEEAALRESTDFAHRPEN